MILRALAFFRAAVFGALVVFALPARAQANGFDFGTLGPCGSA